MSGNVIKKVENDLHFHDLLNPVNIVRKMEIKKAIEEFKSQFELVVPEKFLSELDIKLNFKEGKGNAFFSQNNNKKTIIINVRKFYSSDGFFLKDNFIRVLNHEYLHYLDYKANEQFNKNETFSEDNRVKNDEAILNFQKSILCGQIYQSENNEYNSNDFDRALLINCIASSFKENDVIVLSEKQINQLSYNNLFIFKEFMDYYEGQIFTQKIDNITAKLLKDLEDEDSVASGFFNKLKKEITSIIPYYPTSLVEKNITNKMLSVYMDHEIVRRNFIELCGNDMPFAGKNETIFHLRNLFYTRTLDFYNENPNRNYLRVFALKPPLWYTGEASEKLSFSGDKNAKDFIHDYFDLIINGNSSVMYSNNQEKLDSSISIPDICMRSIRKFIAKNINPVELQKQIEPKKIKF